MPTSAQLAALFEEAGFRILAERAHQVLAERAVPGEVGVARIVTARQPIGVAGWDVYLQVQRPSTSPGRFADYDSVAATSAPLETVEEIGLWLGGWCSHPVSEREVRAIRAGDQRRWGSSSSGT